MYSKEKIIQLLKKENIEYKLMNHNPVYTMEDMVKESVENFVI